MYIIPWSFHAAEYTRLYLPAGFSFAVSLSTQIFTELRPYFYSQKPPIQSRCEASNFTILVPKPNIPQGKFLICDISHLPSIRLKTATLDVAGYGKVKIG
jgi:hypothetical protein